MRKLLAALICCATAAMAAGAPAVSLRLKALLKWNRVHRTLDMAAADLHAIQDVLLDWVDARMSAGVSVQRMNRELAALDLLSEGARGALDLDRSYAGYLGEIAQEKSAAKGLSVLMLPIHTGAACGVDETVAIYSGKPAKRIATFNAWREYNHGFLLRDLAVGPADAAGRRLIASVWVMSNCTSTWNGEALRIDSLGPDGNTPILLDGLGAHLDDELKIAVEGDLVTFRYNAMDRDSSVIIRSAVSAYRVSAGKAVRVPPLAPSYGSFINEWLNLKEPEVGEWSSPEAAQKHAGLVREQWRMFTWKRLAVCGDGTREVTVEWQEPVATSVFRIAGSTARELRMVGVSENETAGCRAVTAKTAGANPVLEDLPN